MTSRAPALLLLLALSACGGGPAPGTPAAYCARQADNDPALKEDLAKSAGNLNWEFQNSGRIEQARSAAIGRCLAGSGASPRGGVERQQ